MSDLATVTVVALRVVGSGLVLAGIAHAALGRALGWTTDTHRDAGALSALVVRLHVGFVGLFLVVLGLVSVVGAASLLGGEPWTVVVTGGLTVVFGARAACEVVAVSRVLREDPRLPTTWRRLHAAALVIWPLVTVTYGLALAQTLTA